MRKYKVYISVVLIILMFFALIFFRGEMVRFISQSRTEQLATVVKENLSDTITKKYDYTQNGENYEYTFLEFGSTGCYACRQMEGVMEEIKNKYAGKIKVVFVNLQKPENRELGDYYGIATIPTQVLLDRNGKEFFRHNGFYSVDDLVKQMNLKR